ncbi:MAG TPA: response regulator transcription factor [Egibacteraceae bacterium]
MAGQRIRVLTADDHPVVRQGLAAVISVEDDLELVGQAADGAEAVALAVETKPDVVVMDLRMPVLDGVAATRQIRAQLPDTAVIVLTLHAEDDTLWQALRAGACSYLLKDASHDDIVTALRAAASGQAVFGTGVAEHVLSRLAGREPVPQVLPELSEREREVVSLLAAGLTTREVARRLYLSDKTVRNLVSAALHKTGVPDRANLIALAREAGLGKG